MSTYLLTWNPKRWHWDMAADLEELTLYGYADCTWSCGRTRRIEIEDRLFLLRQGVEPRGIMASGYAKSSPYADTHWDEHRNDDALYVDVRFDVLLVPEEDGVLPLSHLQDGALATVNWRTQMSGISIKSPAAIELEHLWRRFLEDRGQLPVVIPEEVSTPTLYYEGASRTITVNAYERNSRARKTCIDHYGTACFICGFDFGTTYGALGQGFIHVHHIIPLSEIGQSYIVDPVRDLRPVCPNCHAMLHKRPEGLAVEDLQEIISKESSKRVSSRHI